MSRPGRSSSGSRGFTLVELLVTLALLVLLTSLMTGSLRFAARSLEIGARLDIQQSINVFRHLLQRQLAECLPLRSSDERGILRLSFSGTRDELRFMSSLPSRDGLPAGLYVATLKQSGARLGAGTLSLVFAGVISTGVTGDAGVHKPLQIHSIEQLSISYFGTPRGASKPAWFDSWLGEDKLPQLIRVDVRFPAGDTRIWPPFITELKLGAFR